ncbi:MAG: hypothetical protein ACRCVL_03220 [Cetobacterium sp.]
MIDAFMWPDVNGTVLTNQIAIGSEKTHEVTRCKKALGNDNIWSDKRRKWEEKFTKSNNSRITFIALFPHKRNVLSQSHKIMLFQIQKPFIQGSLRLKK